jgi:hypothetical protein
MEIRLAYNEKYIMEWKKEIVPHIKALLWITEENYEKTFRKMVLYGALVQPRSGYLLNTVDKRYR